MSTAFIRNSIILVLILINFGFDQVSKNIVRERIQDNEQIAIIENCFTLMKVENKGAFMSLGAELSPLMKNILLLGLPTILLLFLLIYVLYDKKLSKGLWIGLSFAIGGGIGNIYDRILLGSVTDFMHLKYGSLQTGIFNIADVSVTLGMIIILISSLTLKPKQETTIEP